MFYRLTFFSALIIAVAATAHASANLLNPHYSQNEKSTAIPFDSPNDLIIVTATINRRGPFHFMVDTGSRHHLITPELSQTLELRVEGKEVVDTGGRRTISAGLTHVAELGSAILH